MVVLSACKHSCGWSQGLYAVSSIRETQASPILGFNTGPPGTNYAVMKRAFDEGWGGVIAKTVSVDSSKVCVMLAAWC